MRRNSVSGFVGLWLLLAGAENGFAITLENNDSTQALKEIIVKGKVPVVKTEGSVTTVRVKGTLLEKMGSGEDMLAQTPGLHLGPSGIEVNELGTPIFVMAGKEVDAQRVMTMVRSNMVKEIKIDRNPDAEYSATGKPVVEIILNKPLNDFLSLDVHNSLTIKRRVSDFPGFTFGFKAGRFLSELDYSTGLSQNENRESYFRDIYTDIGILSLSQNRQDRLKSAGPQWVRWRTDFNINRRNRLGLEYYYNYENDIYKSIGTDVEETGGYGNEISLYDDFRKQQSNLHNVTLQYNHIGKKWTLAFIQDALFKTGHENSTSTSIPENIETTEENIARGETYRHNNYTLLKSNLRLNVNLPLKLRLNSGLRYSYIHSKGITDSKESGSVSGKYGLNSDIDEHQPQAYATLSGTYGKFRLSAGVTYIYLHRSVNTVQSGGNSAENNYHQSEFYPSLSMTYSGSAVNGYVRYSRSVSQPNIGAIGNGLIYQDQYTFSEGNPELRASITNALRGSLSWRDFTFSVNWRHTDSPRVNISEQLYPNSPVIVMKEVNFTKQSNTTLSLSYSKSINKFNLYAEGSMRFSRGKYSYKDEVINNNNISFYANANLTYRLSNTIGFYASFAFQGRHSELILTQRSANDLTAGMTVSLLKDRLNINAKFTDILHKAHYNNSWYAYGNITRGTRGSNDFHGFGLSISYRIFTKDINVKTSRGTEMESFRLQ